MNKLVHPVKRRMRCEIYGCKKMAAFAFGLKGIDMPVCQEHYDQLRTEMFAELRERGGEATKQKYAAAKEA